ncbi:MAG: multiheme c-type cytochrome [Thermoanaerobaculia bacterium]|nr:multiheme c-type cytochrome [Thermoanaerobaculia bacterium]
MTLRMKQTIVAGLSFLFLAALLLVAWQESKRHRIEEGLEPVVTAANEACVECHRKDGPALVMEWERSSHASYGVGCVDCHGAEEGEVDAWLHEGEWTAALVTPKDCARCHAREHDQFAKSHHAKAGEILASLDNVLAEKAAGMPGNIADAVNGCWQCHGSIVRFERGADGEILRTGKENKPVLAAETWPNSGMGRLNPDGSKGSCHACHSRHSFQAEIARSPENCGKCHMGPDHPQIEVYNESKHGIAFYANRDRMALDEKGDWVLGRDYSAAPTCATCHISSYMTTQGEVVPNNHDVGQRISWTLRPVISTKLNLVVYEDGYKEDYPGTRELPAVGDEVDTVEKIVEDEELVNRTVTRRVAKIVPWEERRAAMKGACLNCHNDAFVDNFYVQFDSLVELYNEKFARPAQAIMDELIADGILDPNAPFEKEVQWVFWELWHHEGRRARHGASMMGPDYTHWHGMYEVAKHFYQEFVPAVVEAAEETSPALGEKWARRMDELMARPEHVWHEGLSPEEAEALRRMYEDRYDQAVGSGRAEGTDGE